MGFEEKLLTVIGVLVQPLLGLMIIIFRKQISEKIQASYERMPKYESAFKEFNIRFTVRPIFITILGSIVLTLGILIAIANLLK